MIRGTKRPVPRKTLDLRASIHNRFDIEVTDAVTGKLKKRARAYNVICNAWWTRLFNVSGSYWYPQDRMSCVLFGSGQGTPAETDTGLFTRVGSKNFPSSGSGSLTVTEDLPNGVVYHQGYILLQAGEYVGQTLTEVGIGYDSTHVTTHALLEDMNGNPISITKTDTDVITIYATVYLHFPSGGWYNGSIMVAPKGSYNNYFIQVLLGTNISSTYKLLLYGGGRRTGSITTKVKEATPVLDTVNRKISVSWRWDAADVNLPIRAIDVSYGYYSSGGYTRYNTFWIIPGSWYTQQQITNEAVGTGDGTTTGFATSFPVGQAGTVYVNGVAASGVTMRRGPADVTALREWMNTVYKTNSGYPGFQNGSYEIRSVSPYVYLYLSDLSRGAKSAILENPFSSIAIEKIRLGYATYVSTFELWASDDMEHWSSAGTVTPGSPQNPTEIMIPASLQSKRYWQVENVGDRSVALYMDVVGTATDPIHNIVFDSPPAAGAVITADYTPDCIAKDSNHVFDLSLELTLGEYQEV